MARRALIHPGMLGALPLFYPSKATIQQAVPSGGRFGDQTFTWSLVPNLLDIDCRIAPLTVQTPTFANEARLENLTYLTTTHHVALRGWFPQIQETMRALIDDVAWDIKGVEHDGQASMTTRLRVNRVDL